MTQDFAATSVSMVLQNSCGFLSLLKSHSTHVQWLARYNLIYNQDNTELYTLNIVLSSQVYRFWQPYYRAPLYIPVVIHVM